MKKLCLSTAVSITTTVIVLNILHKLTFILMSLPSIITALHAGRLRVRLPMGSLGFFIDLIPQATLALGSIQPETEMSTRGISWGVRAVGA
jgi:hypothetical protein